jgi:hypothetical protein
MKQKFKSRRDPKIATLLAMPVILVLIMVLLSPSVEVTDVLLVTMLSVLVGWVWNATLYTVTDDEVLYSCGPIKGNIAIDTIEKVKLNTGSVQYGGFKPALSADGVIVFYNTYDSIYLSPDNKLGFANAVKAHNPSIIIEE